jgi:phenylalanyl-tRNA synthetase beta chain
MKVTEHWLREWVNPKQNIQEIADILTLSGLEVDALHDLPNDDHLIDINLTPNRGDCLSIHGVARELAALTQTPLIVKKESSVPVTIDDKKTIKLDSPDCPFYSGRVILNVDNTRPTPKFIQDRLEQLGVRTISLIVDIANYVMFELGQPLHAFDLAKMGSTIIVRDGKSGESLKLLDETIAQLDERTLIISDEKNPLALAGVMGGNDSGVGLETKSIFLESAHFLPQRIAGKTRLFGINSDGAYRFERGVDPKLAQIALERVTALILEYAGGKAGPVTIAGQIPAAKKSIILRLDRINRLLGMDFPKEKVVPILERLGMEVSDEWQVIPPSFRFDISIEADLIEELARVYGYHHIPSHMSAFPIQAIAVPESKLAEDQLRSLCMSRGYHEQITYSFVDHTVQELLTGHTGLPLLNPMSSQMDVMRVSLLPGLLQALCYNQNRQQTHVRLFELGLCFIPEGNNGLKQQHKIAGVLCSQQADKHWQLPKRDANFYDIKGDVESLLALTGLAETFTWQAGEQRALHPGQSALLMHNNVCVGYVGQLHPQLAKQLDLKGKVFVFEIDRDVLLTCKTPHYRELSKFPSIRRDLAIVVDKKVAAQDLCQVVKQQLGRLLQEITIFDVYEGPGIMPDKKSVAMAVMLQSPDRTLNESEINALIQQVIDALDKTYQATIRN